ncbi:hypothetical protein Vretifemale_20546, partial [Volvox reticuliferus]
TTLGADFCGPAAALAAAARSAFCFFMRSLTSRIAASRLAWRTSGFSVRFFWITSREAPTMERLFDFATVRRFFFCTSLTWSFLCCFLYVTVHASFAGLRRLW